MWRPSLSVLSVIAVLGLAMSQAGCGGTGDSGTATPTSGAANAAANGKPKPVAFVGFDISPPLVEALKKGTLQGVVVQNPFRMGHDGVKLVVDKLEGKQPPANVETGEVMITGENITAPENESLVHAPKLESHVDADPSGKKIKKYRVMVIPKGTTHEHWKAVHAGAARAAEDLGNVEIIWQGPQKEDDRLQQIQLVQNAIAAQVDGIVLAPLDSKAMVKPVEDAIAKGIPVVIIDSGLESKKIVSYVATNNYNGGVLGARRLGELLKGEGKIILLRYAVGSASTEEREKGFTDTIAKEFPRITYLSDSEYAGATAETAQQKAQSLVTRYRGQVDGIFCPNESSTFGMLRALDTAGMLRGVQ